MAYLVFVIYFLYMFHGLFGHLPLASIYRCYLSLR